MKLFELAAATLALVLCAPTLARAADVQAGYDFFPAGGIQISDKPIGQSLYSLSFTAPVGGFGLGSQIESVQTGRAGQTYDTISMHLERTYTFGNLAVTSGSILGYGRGLNQDYGFFGAEGRASYKVFSHLSLEANGVTWRSFAMNATPLNHDELSHGEISRLRVAAGPVLVVNDHLSIPFEFGHDFGTIKSSFAGVGVRLHW